MESTRVTSRLHLYGGIPVVEIVGEWGETAIAILTRTVSALTAAGHYEVVVNLMHADYAPADGLSPVAALETLAQSLKRRAGRIHVVGTASQVSGCVRSVKSAILGWATSEEEVVSRIEGLRTCASGPRLVVRIDEKAR